jgi:hypothetical protein
VLVFECLELLRLQVPLQEESGGAQGSRKRARH